MNQLFIVESPLQLLNAYEAIHTFPADHQNLLVRYSNETTNDNQITDTLKKLRLHELATVKTVHINNENKSIIDSVKLIWQKLFSILTLNNYDRIFVGNYDSRFMKFIIGSRKNITLLDDGFKTISIQNTFTNSNYFDWFTIFKLTPFTNQKIHLNSYTNLNKHIKQQKEDTNQVVFIGAKLPEIGIISQQYYIDLISKIAVRYAKKEFIYIPHRGESEDKLKLLEQIDNLTILKLPYPIELLSIYSKLSPTTFASFYSTALITMSEIYKVETIAFEFDYSASENKNDIKHVYDYCKNYISVVKEKEI